jgi:hypothetical protein
MSEKLTLLENDETAENKPKTAKEHIAEARHQLSDEAKQERAEQREIDQRRIQEAEDKRRKDIERAAEQGVDIRTFEEIDRDKRQQRYKEIEALRQELRNNNP